MRSGAPRTVPESDGTGEHAHLKTQVFGGAGGDGVENGGGMDAAVARQNSAVSFTSCGQIHSSPLANMDMRDGGDYTTLGRGIQTWMHRMDRIRLRRKDYGADYGG